MWIAIGIGVGLGLAALVFAVKYSMLKKSVKQAGQDMAEIMKNPEENRILLNASPSREAEQLLRQINRYIAYHQRERVLWQRQERQLQEQIENISHDLRTPLTSILGYLELVDAGKLSREDQEALAVVERKSRYLQGLIGDFYDLSRLERADIRLEQEPVDVARLIREVVLSYYPEFEKRHLEVELALPHEAVMVLGDRKALERIFHNLVQNALRYARSHFEVCIQEADSAIDGEPPKKDEKSRICLDFCDDTDTLTQEDIRCLFDRFYTADHARSGTATGLGLAISRLLAQAMDGEASAVLTPSGELHLLFSFCAAPVWFQGG